MESNVAYLLIAASLTLIGKIVWDWLSRTRLDAELANRVNKMELLMEKLEGVSELKLERIVRIEEGLKFANERLENIESLLRERDKK